MSRGNGLGSWVDRLLDLLAPAAAGCLVCKKHIRHSPHERRGAARAGSGAGTGAGEGEGTGAVTGTGTGAVTGAVPGANVGTGAGSCSADAGYAQDAACRAVAQLLCADCYDAAAWIDAPQCRVCGRAEVCGDCRRRTDAAFVMSRSAVRYEGEMKSWLALYKYRGHEALAPLFGAMLARPLAALTAEVQQRERMYHSANAQSGTSRILGTSLPVSHPPSFPFPFLRAVNGLLHSLRRWAGLPNEAAPMGDFWDGITYVPISNVRALERGFNQAEQMALALAAQHRLPLLHLLQRTRHTEKQSFKVRADRMRDMEAGLFATSPGAAEQLPRPRSCGKLRLLLVDDVYTTGSTLQACAAALQACAQQASHLAPQHAVHQEVRHAVHQAVHQEVSDTLQQQAMASALKLEIYGLTWAR